MTPICTPTKNREEFESILRELDPVGVKWICGGEKPLDWANTIAPYLCYEDLEIYQGYSVEIEGIKILPRAEFVAAINRDFPRDVGKEAQEIVDGWPEWKKAYASGEKGSGMDYEKMLKRKLVMELENRDVEISELRAKTKRQREDWNKDRGYHKAAMADLEKTNAEQSEKLKQTENARFKLEMECALGREENARLKKANETMFEKIRDLEKTNAEQAETIKELKTSLEHSEEHRRDWRLTAEDAAKTITELREENTRIKRLAAQILCADVLEAPK